MNDLILLIQIITYSILFTLIGRYYGANTYNSLLYGWITFGVIAYVFWMVDMTIGDKSILSKKSGCGCS